MTGSLKRQGSGHARKGVTVLMDTVLMDPPSRNLQVEREDLNRLIRRLLGTRSVEPLAMTLTAPSSAILVRRILGGGTLHLRGPAPPDPDSRHRCIKPHLVVGHVPHCVLRAPGVSSTKPVPCIRGIGRVRRIHARSSFPGASEGGRLVGSYARKQLKVRRVDCCEAEDPFPTAARHPRCAARLCSKLQVLPSSPSGFVKRRRTANRESPFVTRRGTSRGVGQDPL